MNTIVIMTALVLEQEAVANKLVNVANYVHPQSTSIYKVGHYISRGKAIQVIVGRTNQSNTNAAAETTRVIQHFNPKYIFFLGVAGGLKDVSIGDIVIGSDVIGFEKGKSDEIFYSRSQFGFSSYELEQNAVSYSISDDWTNKSRNLVDEKYQKEIKVFAGTIASGEKVVSSQSSPIYKFIKENISHALAVEMEGLGFLEACRPYPLIKSLLIRGISDLIIDKSDADKGGSQPYASKNATEFLFGLIENTDVQQETIVQSLKQKLAEIAPKLYPSGLRDQEIWVRSGGDLSLVNLNSTGKSQWVSALLLVENGGGGDIDFQLLIAEMKKDYPKNVSLNEL